MARGSTTTACRRFGAALLALVLSGALFAAASVEAHGRYERSEPADGAVLAESPQRVDVWFSQELRRADSLPTLEVVNFAGDVLSEPAVLDDDDRTHVSVALPPALPNGRYTVIWHTLSDEDDEEARGAFHFYVGEGPDAISRIILTPSPTVPPTATPVPPPAPDGDDGGLSVWLIALVGAVAGGVVGAGFMFAARRAGR